MTILFCFFLLLSIKERTATVPVLFFSFLFPPSLRYNITHSSNLNFYLGITHLKKNIISSFMLQERPLSLKLIFHYYNQINRLRDRILWMRDVLTNFLCFLFLFSFSLYCFCSWSILVSCFLFFFFFFFFSSSTLPPSFLFFSFLSFFSRQSVHLFVACLFLFFFLFTSFNSSIFFVLFVDVVLWCLKLSFTVTRFVLSPWKTLLAEAPNRTCYILT